MKIELIKEQKILEMETETWTAKIILSKRPSSEKYIIEFIRWFNEDSEYNFDTKEEEMEACDIIKETVNKYKWIIQ